MTSKVTKLEIQKQLDLIFKNLKKSTEGMDDLSRKFFIRSQIESTLEWAFFYKQETINRAGKDGFFKKLLKNIKFYFKKKQLEKHVEKYLEKKLQTL